VNLRFEGLDEFRKDLHTLPADLVRETQPTIVAAAETTASALRAAYPFRTGAMRRGVRVRTRTTAWSTAATVSSTAPTAVLWEYGTQIRRTQRGWNRGAAPAHQGQGLYSLAIRQRRQVDKAIAAVLTHHNFRVSG
jgi:Bacteriophage HK97-gp10, putative tail-component